ncbi:MAG: DegT/DnrJ/EryC1/StrS family aminotransferase [Saprospiraceae bacterium]|nr:DegT/DnrJ/EryC1/StrS family aminotransferase [Saprospiraceae bacterium]
MNYIEYILRKKKLKENNDIFVTRPDLPDLDDFVKELQQIWESGWLTNMGTFHKSLEEELKAYLGVKYISLFCNGTIALMTALKALNIQGEVITTPYSFVATAHSIVWNGLKPVFVDVLPENGNLDPDKIEQAITKNTSAIMPVHVYGNPCEVERIQEIADKQGLKVIYDAAHAFGVKKDDVSILNYGDLSILSFHATKVFNTIEGGAIISDTAEMKLKIDRLKNFGFVNEEVVEGIGINGKMNELQAAWGILNLKNIKKSLAKRKEIFEYYTNKIKNIEGFRIIIPQEKVKSNYSYLPCIIDDNYKLSRNDLYDKLRNEGIYARKYFYPLISEFPNYKELETAKPWCLTNAYELSNKILCLPISTNLTVQDLNRICNLI